MSARPHIARPPRSDFPPRPARPPGDPFHPAPPSTPGRRRRIAPPRAHQRRENVPSAPPWPQSSRPDRTYARASAPPGERRDALRTQQALRVPGTSARLDARAARRRHRSDASRSQRNGQRRQIVIYTKLKDVETAWSPPVNRRSGIVDARRLRALVPPSAGTGARATGARAPPATPTAPAQGALRGDRENASPRAGPGVRGVRCLSYALTAHRQLCASSSSGSGPR